jgi:hypothetical protein
MPAHGLDITMVYKPPHSGVFDFFLASPRQARKMSEDIKNYRAGYLRGRGARDAVRRR